MTEPAFDHLGLQLDAGNYFKIVGGEPYFRIGDRNTNSYIPPL